MPAPPAEQERERERLCRFASVIRNCGRGFDSMLALQLAWSKIRSNEHKPAFELKRPPPHRPNEPLFWRVAAASALPAPSSAPCFATAACQEEVTGPLKNVQRHLGGTERALSLLLQGSARQSLVLSAICGKADAPGSCLCKRLTLNFLLSDTEKQIAYAKHPYFLEQELVTRPKIEKKKAGITWGKRAGLHSC